MVDGFYRVQLLLEKVYFMQMELASSPRWGKKVFLYTMDSRQNKLDFQASAVKLRPFLRPVQCLIIWFSIEVYTCNTLVCEAEPSTAHMQCRHLNLGLQNDSHM